MVACVGYVYGVKLELKDERQKFNIYTDKPTKNELKE